MKGLIIIGSAQVNSHTSALARYLTEHFKTHDIEAEIFDLAEKPLNQLDFQEQHRLLMKSNKIWKI